MKRYIVWLMAMLVLAISMVFYTGMAAAVGTEQEAPCVDAVIVMDQSSSMDGTQGSKVTNDPTKNRFDAALMLISMCDMNGSRAAFIPFANSVIESSTYTYFNRFMSIRELYERKAMMDQITTLSNGRTQVGTDYGVALAAAVNMLLKRVDKTNKPMIILLTDGNNQVIGNGNKKVYEWNDAAGFFTEKDANSKYTDNTADLLVDKVASVAASHGIPIYTIPLLNNRSSSRAQENRELENKLRSIASITGGEFEPIVSENASELPHIFGQMFAKQIGSQLRDQKPVSAGGNHYRVELPILNQSLLEANIFIPITDIENVTLYYPQEEGKPQAVADALQFDSAHFKLFKIREPQILGTWVLEYDLKNTAKLAKNISISLLYNYSVALKTRLGSTLSGMQEPGQGITLDKGDKLLLESCFYGADGYPTLDTALYKVWDPDAETGDSWKTIKGTYTLFSADGKNTIFSGKMDNMADSFHAEIDLAHILPDGQGFNSLNEGDYKLKINTDGAGLFRENTLNIRLENNLPEAADGSGRQELTTTVMVDMPERPETQQVQHIEFNLSDLISDPDNDRVVYQLNKVSGSEILPLSYNANTNIISGDTVIDESGMFFYGDAVYNLTVKDSDASSRPTVWKLIVHVDSYASTILGNYRCVTSAENIDQSGEVKKGTDVIFTMYLKDMTTQGPDTTGLIRQYTGHVDICLADNTSNVLDSIDMEPNDKKNAMTAKYTTPYKSNRLIARFTYLYSSYSNQKMTDSIEFMVPNTPPQVVAPVMQAFPKRITYEALPNFLFLPMLEKTTPEETLVIPLDKLFIDADNEPLTYSAPVLQSGDDGGADLMNWVREGTNLRFTPKGVGDLKITVTAEDGDTFVNAEFIVTISSVLAKWTRIGVLALAAVMALILLYLIIHQIRKPCYPDAKLEVYENSEGYPKESPTNTSPASKKRKKLSAFVDELYANSNGIPAGTLKKILIKPSRSKDGSILVRCKIFFKKQCPYCVVKLDGDESALGHRYRYWGSGQELILTSGHTGKYIRVRLADNQDEYTSTGSARYNGGDSWDNENDFSSQINTSKRRRGTKGNRKNEYDSTDL